MKKITFLAAAVAMLAFASCNKEEGQVALKFGGERYTSDKQAYEDNYVRFTNGEDIFVNGVAYHLNAKGDGRTATVWCPADSEYSVVYGDVTIAEDSSIHTIFMANVDGIPEGYTTLGSTHNPWPLTAFVTAANANTNFTLLHSVAIVSGGVKLGGSFFPYINAKLGETGAGNPTIKFTKMELSSTQVKMYGPATLQTENEVDGVLVPCTPYFVMDEDLSENSETLTVLVPGAPELTVATASNYGERYFNTTMVPCETAGVPFTIAFYFTATYSNGNVHYFKYCVEDKLTTDVFCFKRGERIDLKANLYDQQTGNWDIKIKVLD